MVQILDAPVTQMVEQLPDVMRFFDFTSACSRAGCRSAQRSCSMTSLCALFCATRSWRNSWWKCQRSFPFLPCSGLWSSTSTFQFLVVEGENAGLQGFLPGQGSTAQHGSLELVSERIVEQFVDIPVGGGLQDFRPGQSSSSSSHVPARVSLRMHLVKGFFALFPNFKKMRSWVRTRVRGCPPVSAHPHWRLSSRMRPCRTPTSGCSSVTPFLLLPPLPHPPTHHPLSPPLPSSPPPPPTHTHTTTTTTTRVRGHFGSRAISVQASCKASVRPSVSEGWFAVVKMSRLVRKLIVSVPRLCCFSVQFG